jgi:O-antigen ligase
MKLAFGAAGPVLVMLALIAPWLVPPQSAPSAAVLPWLFSLACTSVLLRVLPVSVAGWRSFEWRAMLAGAWLIAALVSSAIGLCQYFGVAQYFAFMSPSRAGEAFANLRQRNQFATLTNMGLMALLWWVARTQKTEWVKPISWAWLLAAVVLAMGNAISSSRTGLVQLILIIFMALWWWGPRHSAVRQVLAAALLSYVLAALILPSLAGLDLASSGIWARLQNGGPQCASRLTLWSNVLHLISLRPWLGWGWGELDYAHFVTLYPGARFCEILDNAHNLPLHLAVELGIPVSLLICGGLSWLILRARPWRETDDTRRMAWGITAMILLHSLLEYPLWYGPFQIALGLCLGLLWPAPTNTLVAVEANQNTRVPMWQVIVSISLMAAAAYAAWDYHRISQIYREPEQRSPAYRDNTLEKISASWLFRDQVHFAEFTLTPLTRDNALQLNTMAHELLHYSPEARVVEKLIESAILLGRDEEALFFLARYRAAYPEAHANWVKEQVR